MFIFLLGCDQPATQPEPIKLGKRDYVWNTDTLMYPNSYQTNMRSIFGTSVNNVYVCGHNDQNRGMMYHFDGNRWSPVALTYSEGGPIQRGMDLNAMHGSGTNDIWAVGEEDYLSSGETGIIDSSLVIHHDGVQWKYCEIPDRGRALFCVHALSPSSVWAAGGGGLIFNWNGKGWTKYQVGKQYFIGSITALSENEAYAFGHVSDDVVPVDSAGSFLFQFVGTNWKVIDSVMSTPGAPIAHLGIELYSAQGYLYTASPNVYRKDGSRWIKLVDAQVGHMWQSASNNIVAVGRTAWHFNGLDWKEFASFDPSFLWFNCYTDGNEVFIVGNNNYTTIIKHGK